MFAPMSLGELLDGSFTLYRRHFKTLVLVAAICYGPFQVIGAYVQMSGGWINHLILAIPYIGTALVGSLLGMAAIVRIVSNGYLDRETSFEEAIQFAFGKIIGLMVVGMASGILIFLASLLLLVPGIIVACGYSVATQVVVLEDLKSSTDALGRSWFLTKGHKGTAFGLAFVLYVVYVLPAFVMGVLSLTPLALPANIIGTVLSIILTPLIACGFTLFYYDLRVRKEAFDLHVLGQLMDSAPAR